MGDTSAVNLFPNGLTPQRSYLLRQTRERISRCSLRTADLQLALLHFREMKLGDWLFESASSIAHATRNQGVFWSWGLNVWATHVFYEFLDKERMDVSTLPLDVFNSIREVIDRRPEWQLEEELSDLYPLGISKAEVLATLDYLYTRKRERRSEPVFVQLASKGGNADEDLRLVVRLVRYCEPFALQIPPAPIEPIVDDVDSAFGRLLPDHRAFRRSERVYLQLHLLVCFHNTLLEIRNDVFKALTRSDAPARQAMLSVSAMDDNLALDIAFYYRDSRGHLEQEDLRSPDRFERFRAPLVGTELPENRYLLESDLNIRCCLYNHPLEVRNRAGKPMIVALERSNAMYRPTRPRVGE